MSIANFTRRAFLKYACIVTGVALVGLRFTGKAVAATKKLKEYMLLPRTTSRSRSSTRTSWSIP